MKNLYILITLLVFSACADRQDRIAENGVININLEVDNAIKSGIITEISDSVFVIPLQDVPLGMVYDLKVYENIIAILQGGQGVVDFFDFTGKQINLLNKKGRAPGEYTELYDVALLDNNSKVAITTLSDIMYYSFPELEYLYKDTMQMSSSPRLSNLNDSSLLLLEDGEREWGLEILSNRQEKMLFPLSHTEEWSSDVENDLFTRNSSKSEIYRVSCNGEMHKLVNIDFGEHAISDSHFKKEESGRGLLNGMLDEVYKFRKAGFVHFPIVTDEKVSFMYNKGESSYGNSRLYVYDVATEKSVNYETLSIAKVWPNLVVYGTYKDFFVTLIIPENCIIDEEDEPMLDSLVGQLILREKQSVKKASDIAHPLLVFFRPKVN